MDVPTVCRMCVFLFTYFLCNPCIIVVYLLLYVWMRAVCGMVSYGEEGSIWCVQGQAASPHQLQPKLCQCSCVLRQPLLFIWVQSICCFVCGAMYSVCLQVYVLIQPNVYCSCNIKVCKVHVICCVWWYLSLLFPGKVWFLIDGVMC